jgi:MFS family permease
MTAIEHTKVKLVRGEANLCAVLPVMAAVLVGFLVIGVGMPVLPLHVHETLGQSALVVGLVAGAQFGVALISRPWAGRHADERGPKQTVVAGLIVSAVAGLFYLLSLRFVTAPTMAIAILLVGRSLLGAGESFIITGAQVWGLALIGPHNTGKVLAWMGTAMYAAFALGAPAGDLLYARHGFAFVALATATVPLATLLFIVPVRGIAPLVRGTRVGLGRILASVWLPGVGSALSSIGFGAMIAFVSVLFSARGWVVWPAFTAFAVAFIAARLLLGHLADRAGSARLALVCVLVEAVGLVLIAVTGSSAIALVGAALTGFGYSLVYPAFGVEAVRLAPAEDRGLAMGAYTAFLDLALGVAGPGLGLVAEMAGLDAVFVASALAALGSAAVAVVFIRRRVGLNHRRLG